MNRFAGLQHIGLPVRSVETTKSFYESLGFRTLYSTSDGTSEVAFLGLNGLVIEAYEKTEFSGGGSTWDHLAIEVNDIEGTWCDIVTNLGFASIEGEIKFLPFWDNGIRFFSIHGPDNEKIEFCQKL